MTQASLLRRWEALSPRVRLAAAGGVVLFVLAVVAAFACARDTRAALFAAPLRPDQMAEVEQRLAAWNVPYVALADNVRVDANRRSSLLLRLALAGVPHPHLAGSDEALAHLGALTPQSVLEAQTRDALAADLALGLRGLDGVADARVVIAPASGGIYADDVRRDASASVRITPAPGARLAARTVAGIKAFVAGGVPGLDAQRVTVVDDRGVALDGAADDSSDVQAALQSALDAAFGAGATIVRVHREPLGEQRDVRSVRRAVLPGALTRTTSDERYASNAKRYSKTGASEERATESREERRVADPSATGRLTVAVFADAARGLDLRAIRELAAATAGLRSERGDAVRVEAVAFSGTPRVATRFAAPSWLLAMLSIVPQIAAAIGVVVVAALGIKPLVAVLTRAADASAARTVAREVAGVPAARVRAVLDGEPPHVAAAIITRLSAADAAAVLELYAPEERAAIVRRLGRTAVTLLPPAEELARA